MKLPVQKILALTAALTALALTLSSCSVFHRGTSKVAPEEVAFMLMLWAPSGTLQETGSRNSEFSLTLKGPALTATFISHQPKRLAAQVPLARLVETWGKMGLADNPPYAAVVANEGKAEEKSMTGEILDPKWNAQTNEISFTLRPVARASAVTSNAFTAPPGDNLLPAIFGQVTVMIDPSNYQGVEYIVTSEGVIALRESYAAKGIHPIDLLPPVTYIGPDYFGTQRQAAVKADK